MLTRGSRRRKEQVTDTVLALFKTREEAERAVRALVDAGFLKDQIGMLGPGHEERHPYEKSLAAGVGGGTAVGAVAGGLLTAAAVGLVPGIGPVLAAGSLVPVIMGTATTAATGGVVGALVALAGNDDEALYYQQQVEAGNWLVTVRTDDRARAVEVLKDAGGFGLPSR